METPLLRFILARFDLRVGILFRQIVTLHRFPTVEQAIMIACELFLIGGLAAAAYLKAELDSPQRVLGSAMQVYSLITFLGFVQLALLPVITAGIAGAFVGRDAASEMYRLLPLTNVSQNVIINTYFLVAFYLVRVLIISAAFMVGFFAPAVIATQVTVANMGIISMIPYDEALVIGSAFLGFSLLYWNLNVLAVAIGVRLGVMLRSSGAAAALASGAMLVCVILAEMFNLYLDIYVGNLPSQILRAGIMWVAAVLPIPAAWLVLTMTNPLKWMHQLRARASGSTD